MTRQRTRAGGRDGRNARVTQTAEEGGGRYTKAVTESRVWVSPTSGAELEASIRHGGD